MARKHTSVTNASAEELGAASEGQAAQMEARSGVGEYGPDAWPVNWNGIVIGMLGALAALVVVGLSGMALGAHQTAGPNRVLDWKTVGWATLIFSVFGTFLSFALGGWIAGQIAGFRRAESCMLHGACSWLLSLPVLAALAGLGAAGMYGGWLSGLNPNHPGWSYGTSPGVELRASLPGEANAPTVSASGSRIVTDADVARAARNTALGTVAALLLGLMGSVVGGWISSGEPMTIGHYRTAPAAAR